MYPNFNNFSLFIGAARSYRHDSSLSPFPPFFIDAAGNKDIKGERFSVLDLETKAQMDTVYDDHAVCFLCG